MFCRHCGVDDDKNVIKRKVVEDGDIISIYYFGRCSECDTLLGEKEIFRYKDKVYLSPQEVQLILDIID